MKVPRIIHFEIEAEKPERAIEFYKRVFKWKVEKWKGPIEYWLITTGNKDEPGIDGGCQEGRTINLQQSTRLMSLPWMNMYVKLRAMGGQLSDQRWRFLVLDGWCISRILKETFLG